MEVFVCPGSELVGRAPSPKKQSKFNGNVVIFEIFIHYLRKIDFQKLIEIKIKVILMGNILEGVANGLAITKKRPNFKK